MLAKLPVAFAMVSFMVQAQAQGNGPFLCNVIESGWTLHQVVTTPGHTNHHGPYTRSSAFALEGGTAQAFGYIPAYTLASDSTSSSASGGISEQWIYHGPRWFGSATSFGMLYSQGGARGSDSAGVVGIGRYTDDLRGPVVVKGAASVGGSGGSATVAMPLLVNGVPVAVPISISNGGVGGASFDETEPVPPKSNNMTETFTWDGVFSVSSRVSVSAWWFDAQGSGAVEVGGLVQVVLGDGIF